MGALDDALRRGVACEKDEALRVARRDADALLHRARRECDDLIEAARRDATARAGAAIARERAALRREALRTVLDAKRAIVDDVEARVLEAVTALRDDTNYERLLDGLESRARARLGSDAIVTRDPLDVGGVVAEHDGRRVDYTLPALAGLASADLDSATAELLA